MESNIFGTLSLTSIIHHTLSQYAQSSRQKEKVRLQFLTFVSHFASFWLHIFDILCSLFFESPTTFLKLLSLLQNRVWLQWLGGHSIDMAVDVCSEISSTGISPRISFSYDLNQTDVLPIERSDLTLLDSSSDFVFCIGNNSFVQELSPADELFSNGKIRAKEIKKNVTTPDENEIRHSQSQSVSFCSRSHQPSPSSSSFTGNSEKKQLKEFLSNSFDIEDEKPASKSFWQFKRSSSLNCDSSRSRSLIRSLQFLSRSNSTGSSVLNSNSKKSTLNSTKETQKPHLQKQPSVSSRKSSASSSSSCSSTYYFYSASQRPSLKKNNSGSYGNGVRISPVLNLTPPYISRVTVSFFGFGSLFCNGKVKNKKK